MIVAHVDIHDVPRLPKRNERSIRIKASLKSWRSKWKIRADNPQQRKKILELLGTISPEAFTVRHRKEYCRVELHR